MAILTNTGVGALLAATSMDRAQLMSNLTVQGQLLKHFNIVNFTGENVAVPVWADDSYGTGYRTVGPMAEFSNADTMNISLGNGAILQPKRFAKTIDFSNQFLNNTDEQNLELVKKIAMTDFLAQFERHLLTQGYKSNDTTDVKNTKLPLLFQYTTMTTSNMQLGANSNTLSFKFADLLNAKLTQLGTLGDLSGAFWILSNQFKCSVIGDDGFEKIDFDTPTLPGSAGWLMGLPVYYKSSVSGTGDTIAFALVHPHAANVMLSDIKVTKISADTLTLLPGKTTFLCEVYGDVGITDSAAIICYGAELAQ